MKAIRCDTCPLTAHQVTERQVIAGWTILAEGLQSAEAVQMADLEDLPLSPEKAAAIRSCYVARLLIGECVTSKLHTFVDADF